MGREEGKEEFCCLLLPKQPEIESGVDFNVKHGADKLGAGFWKQYIEIGAVVIENKFSKNARQRRINSRIHTTRVL